MIRVESQRKSFPKADVVPEEGPVEVTPWRLTVDDYHRMAQAGILGEDDRVELIEGRLVEMTPIGSRHAACINALTQILVRAVGDERIVSPQNPIQLDNYSEPQPDITLLQPRDDRYRPALPTPKDVILIVEVSDSSLAYDRGVKLPLYAAAGIPEAWIVELQSGSIVRHTEPVDGSYRAVAAVGHGKSLASTIVSDLTLDVDKPLGPMEASH